MNTKTMRLPPRRVLTTEKRKERDGLISPAVKPPESAVTKFPPPANLAPPPVNSISKKPLIAAEPVGSNRLILAGYLSHEFLTNGTLFGEQLNPARAQAGPPEPKKVKPNHIEESEPKRKRYMEVANLLKADGTHLPDIVNPAQLARFLKL